MVDSLISIIIPVYNVENYINKCISSVLCQSYENLEIIVIDDGSTDNTREIVKKLCETDLRIILIEQENHGVSFARNVGIKHAKGDYLMFIDGDDWLEKDAICQMLLYAINSDAEIIKGSFIWRDPIHNIKRDYILAEKKYEKQEVIKMFLCGRNIPSSVCGSLYKRDFIYKNNLFFNEDEKIGEDGIFTMKALDKANAVYLTSVPVYNVRVREGSASRKDIVFSSEHRFADEVIRDPSLKDFVGTFKLRVMLTNLYRTALVASYSDFSKLYDMQVSHDKFAELNSGKHRRFLKRMNNCLALLAKSKALFFLSFKSIKFFGYKPLL